MKETICELFQVAYDRRWISTRDGNASFRCANDTCYYVTPSGVRKNKLTPSMMIKMTAQSQPEIRDDHLKPTGEILLHSMLHTLPPSSSASTSSRVVLHLHPTYTIAAMYAGIDLQKLARDFPEINRYTKVGPTVPIVPPVSAQLAHAAVANLGLFAETGEVLYDIIGLDRHGIISVAEDPWTAFEHAERLEHIAQIALAARN